MLHWLAANWGTLLAGSVVLLIVVAVLGSLMKNKRKGKSACGCSGGCAGCALCGSCHSGEPEKRLSSK